MTKADALAYIRQELLKTARLMRMDAQAQVDVTRPYHQAGKISDDVFHTTLLLSSFLADWADTVERDADKCTALIEQDARQN